MKSVKNSAKLNAAEKIWQIYKKVKGQAGVGRSGFVLFGLCYELETMNEAGRAKPETDLEHAAACAALAWILVSFYPELPISYDDCALMLLHDLPENEIGDIPDDGTRDNDKKDRLELEFMQEFKKLLPIEMSESFVQLYISFQKKDSRRTKLLYYIDKTEAILQCLMLESYGVDGKIKKREMTDTDRLHMEQCNSEYVADLWFFRLLINPDVEPSQDLALLLEVIKTGYADIGRDFPQWAEEFLEKSRNL